MKLLTLIDLPDRVMAPFQQGMEVFRGTLNDAQSVLPDALLCSIQPCRLDAEAIARLPSSIRIIATYSVGHDHIDLQEARKRGIAVFNTPGVLGDAVADAAMLLMLGAARRATESIDLIRSGKWQGWTPTQLIGSQLGGRTLGILGMGDIGHRIARRARGFGMDIAYHNRRDLDVVDAHYFADPRDLIASADVVVLAWPSTAATRHFICAETLRLARPSLILVNIGRGDLVCDTDLIASLREGQIEAAGLDVFENEPAINPGYLELPNAFLLPHVGSSTWEARIGMAQVLVDAISAYELGDTPFNRIA